MMVNRGDGGGVGVGGGGGRVVVSRGGGGIVVGGDNGGGGGGGGGASRGGGSDGGESGGGDIVVVYSCGKGLPRSRGSHRVNPQVKHPLHMEESTHKVPKSAFTRLAEYLAALPAWCKKCLPGR